MSILATIDDTDAYTATEMKRLGKELGLNAVEEDELGEVLSWDVLQMPISSMRTTVTLDNTDASAKRRLSLIVAENDARCHGEAFKKGKATAVKQPKNQHTIKGKTYEFPSAVTRSHAKTLVHHGYNVLADTGLAV